MKPPDEAEEEDASERTFVRRPNALMGVLDPGDEMEHVLLRHTAGVAPLMRLRRGPTVIGRADGCDLVLTGGDVSRRHCQVDLVGIDVIAGGEVLLTDLGSTNGTFVDGTKVSQAVALAPGARISVGGHQLLYDRRSRRELDEAEALERELHRANQYVLAILPLPLREGPVLAEWYFLPCTSLGGDAFGYRELGHGVFAGYILDVAGHGVGAAMHSVSVANVLRQDGMLGADLRDPASVMTRLNDSFPMETHDGLFFTAWYWVYDTAQRTLTYCSAGHHPAYLMRHPSAEPQPLQARNPAIGFMPGMAFKSERVDIAPGSTLYLFSDGVFEIEDKAQRRWGIDEFVAMLREKRRLGVTEPQRLYDRVRENARPGPLEDDFSLVALSFP